MAPLDLFALDQAIYDEVVSTINARLQKQYPDKEGSVKLEDVLEILHIVFSDLFTFGTEQLKMLTNSTLTNERKKMYFSVEAQQRSRQYADDGYSRP